MTHRSALAPAFVAALVPKCPFCVAAWLSLFGVGSGAAEAVAPLLRTSALGVAAIAIGALLLPLGKAALRSRDHLALLVAAGAACAALALCIAGAPLPVRIGALVAMALGWRWAERRVTLDDRADCCASRAVRTATK
jgi:hypothetical protein